MEVWSSMKEDLIKLLNTLALVETKGQNTVLMANCMRHVEILIQRCPEGDASAEETKED